MTTNTAGMKQIGEDPPILGTRGMIAIQEVNENLELNGNQEVNEIREEIGNPGNPDLIVTGVIVNPGREMGGEIESRDERDVALIDVVSHGVRTKDGTLEKWTTGTPDQPGGTTTPCVETRKAR